MELKWRAVTAGFGSADFAGAARRVSQNLKELKIFADVHCFQAEDFRECAPRTYNKYSEHFNESVKGFGYMAWKAEIVQRMISGIYGDCEGVIWVDAGCEVNKNFIARARLRDMLVTAEKSGVFAFTLDTPEFRYSKHQLVKEFPNIDLRTPQIQTTWLALAGERGRQIADSWLEFCLKDLVLLDDSLSESDIQSDLIAHRHDQSVFSLVCKMFGYYGVSYLPPSGRSSQIKKVGALIHPIWSSRNRTPISIKGKRIQQLDSLFR